jgi:predicted nucleic acid-binding protein
MPAADTFFDTNVLLYLLSDDMVKAARAETLLVDGGVISVQVLNEFASVVIRKQVLTFDELKEVLSTLRAACSVKPLDIETHELGLNIAERYLYSFYDSLIIAAALRSGCPVLYTEDMHDGHRIEQLVIRNPFAE